MKNNTMSYYSPKQGRFPVFLADSLDICDPVLVFDQIMEEIGIEQYLRPEPLYRYGRPGSGDDSWTIRFSVPDRRGGVRPRQRPSQEQGAEILREAERIHTKAEGICEKDPDLRPGTQQLFQSGP